MARPLKPIFDQDEQARFIKPLINRPVQITFLHEGHLRTHGFILAESEQLADLLHAEACVRQLCQAPQPPAYEQHPCPHSLDYRLLFPSSAMRTLHGAWNTLATALHGSDGKPHDRLEHRLHPRLATFYQVYDPLLREHEAYFSMLEAREHHAMLAHFTQAYTKTFLDFKQAIAQPSLIKQIKIQQIRVSRYRRQLQDYLQALLTAHGSLWVLELELGYMTQQRPAQPFQRLQADFTRFMAERRHNPLWRDDLVGFIWKLAEGLKRGYTYHLVLFYRGDRAEAHQGDLELLQKRWIQDITQGAGACYQRARLTQPALENVQGLIDSPQSPTYQALTDLLDYLCKLDLLLWLEPPKGHNTLGRGNTPGSRRPGPRPKATSPAVNTTTDSTANE